VCNEGCQDRWLLDRRCRVLNKGSRSGQRGQRWPGRRPQERRAGRFGRRRWKSLMMLGSRMSSTGTQNHSSGPYPSQSTRYCNLPPRHLAFRRELTAYVGLPSMSRGGGGVGDCISEGTRNHRPEEGNVKRG
jgi:hypothetical protein